MPDIEEEVIGSHTEDSEQHEQQVDAGMDEVFSAFGIEKDEKEKAEEDAPAIEQKPESKMVKVKHNKEDVEVDISTDEKLTDHLQRSLALDKERDRREKNDQLLKEAAKLLGQETLDEATIQRLSQDRQQQDQGEFEQLKQKVIEDLVYNGVDEEAAREYAETNPLVAKAREALERDEINRQGEAGRGKWRALYEAYPHLEEDSNAWDRGESPTFFTPEMQLRIERGYDPLDAFELAHKGTLAAQTKKAAEQKVIKQQQLGLRSRVETVASSDNDPQVPAALASAFAAFGLPTSAAQKYVKK